MSGLRLRSVKFKNGGEIRAFPADKSNFRRVDLGWAEVVFRIYGGDEVLNRDITYMCDAVKNVVINRGA